MQHKGDERSKTHACSHAVPWMQLHLSQGHGQGCGHTSRRDRIGHGHQRVYGAATLFHVLSIVRKAARFGENTSQKST